MTTVNSILEIYLSFSFLFIKMRKSSLEADMNAHQKVNFATKNSTRQTDIRKGQQNSPQSKTIPKRVLNCDKKG